MSARYLFTTAALAMTLAAPAMAQEINHLDVHGFGSWSYGHTNNGNTYLQALPEGDYRGSSFALNFSAALNDRLHVFAQTSWDATDDGTQNDFDYAFAEYTVSDALRLRFGQVKQPFGIYTEVYDVGTIRPFFSLPQGVYGRAGFSGESYKGVGLTGSQGMGRWRADYDLYAGGQNMTVDHVAEAYYRGESLTDASNEAEEQSVRDVVGGRVVMRTPISGLSFGGSANSGTMDEATAHRRTVVGGQLEYLNDVWSLRSEYAQMRQNLDESSHGYYVEAARFFTPHWQGAVQYNDLQSSFVGVDASTAPSLQKHTETAVGLNYWFSPELAVKLSVQNVEGNRFSYPHPELLDAAIAAGTLKTHTTLLRFGTQFAF